MSILPLNFANLNKALTSEDFPAPVLPMTPTFSPGNILTEIFFKTIGKSGA